MNNSIESEKIRVAADLLEQHSKVHWLSLLLTAGALLLMLQQVLTAALGLGRFAVILAVVFAGLLELLYAIRVGFDVHLLRQLVINPAATDDNLNQLDEALVQLKLLAKEKCGKSLDQRLAGCMCLFKKQLLVCGLQLFIICAVSLYLVII